MLAYIAAAVASGLRRVWGCGLVATLGLALFASGGADSVDAQQLTIPPQYQQQVQQLLQGSQGGSTALPPAVAPSQTTLQPAAPVTQSPGTSRLEQIMSQRAGVVLHQFGYDQFGVAQSVTIPQVGAVPDDYILGSGDQIVVSLQGQENAQYNVTVDRNGQVLLPKLPPIPAVGRTFGAFRQDLLAAIHRAYISTQGYISLGQLRQISVLVAGQVNNPGTRIVTALSTPVDAILISGGIVKTGSLRNVKLIRNGQTTTIDLYDLLTASSTRKHVTLTDGDRIVVPPLGPTVAVTGWVRQPAIYELPPGGSGISARSLLSLAGGTEVRGRYNISVLRVNAAGQTELEPADERAQLHDSDILYVQPAASQTTSNATLSGGTALAGRYPITTGTKLSDIIKAPGALGPSPYTLLGVISRRDPKTYLRTVMAFSPVAVLAGREDMALQSNDIVRVFSIEESQMLRAAIDSYRQYQQNQQQLARNPQASTLSQVGQPYDFSSAQTSGASTQQQAQATQSESVLGGSPQAAAALPAELQQHVASLAGGTGQSGGVAPSEANTAATAVLGAAAQAQSASPGNTEAVTQALTNQNLTPQLAGAAPETSRSQNFETETPSPGGVPTNVEAVTFGQVASQLGIAPLVLANFLSDHTVTINGAVRGPGVYLVGPDVTLAETVQAAGGTLNWADNSGVELTTTQVDRRTGQSKTQRVTLPLNQGMLASYTVHPRDEVNFRQVFANVDIGSVTVQGELRFPGTYQISRGERLSDLLIRAGGLTNVAYPYGTIYLRKSAAALEETGYQRGADEIESQLLVGLAQTGSQQLSPEAFSALQGFVNQMRNTVALGRISVDADPSLLLAHPSDDMLLEAGDVIYIPQRPSTIAVLGQVLQPGSFAYQPGESVEDYIAKAGGYAQFADDSDTFVVLPDGTATQVHSSWLNFNRPDIPPGSAVVVPRDLTPLNLHQLILDATSITSQLAISAASLAVLSKQ